MDLPVNRFKHALARGLRQYGMWLSIPDTGVAEMMAQSGLDWIVIDTEHAAIDAVRALPLMQAMNGGTAAAVLRPGWNDFVEIKKMLDCGAQTVLVPYIQNADEAAQAVRALRYPPEGIRGVAGLTRASGYGAIDDYIRKANAEMCLLAQVETVEALANLDDILKVPGVDGVFIGPADLSASIGYAGQPGHPEVRAAILDAIRRIRAAGVAPGILSLDQGFLRQADEAGALFLAMDVDINLLRRALLARLAEWR